MHRAAHSTRCHQGGQRQDLDERSARGAKSTRASMPLLRQQHAHHRDLLARATTETQTHANSAKDQDRHLMMTELMLDTCKYAQCLCWLRADNVIPCVVTSMLPFGKTQKRKIALQSRSVTRSQFNSRTCRGQNCPRCRHLPPHRRLTPRRNPHSCGTAYVPQPRFRALALFGRRPPERVVGIVDAGVQKPAHNLPSALQK